MYAKLAFLGVVVGTMGCQDIGIVVPPDINDRGRLGSVTGRVCDQSGMSWQEDAMAYTNVTDDDGIIVDVKRSYSDRDGYWTLPDLLPGREYSIFVQHGSEVLAEELVHVDKGEHVELEEPNCFEPLEVSIALVSGDYDDVHLVLQNMGFANFTLVDGTDADDLAAFLSDSANLDPYDIVFFNGGHAEEGIFYDVNPANTVPETVRQSLSDYVSGGGSVFATDWSYDILELGWPEAVDFLGDDATPNAAQLGEYDLINAMVTDEALAEFLGTESVQIEYDLPVWPPITSVEGFVSIHLTGTVRYREGSSAYTLASVPLLVSFSAGNGRVGYSTFRIAANQSDEMVAILQYMMNEL